MNAQCATYSLSLLLNWSSLSQQAGSNYSSPDGWKEIKSDSVSPAHHSSLLSVSDRILKFQLRFRATSGGVCESCLKKLWSV